MEDIYNNFCKGYHIDKYLVKYDVESLKSDKHIVKQILPTSIENYPLVTLIHRYIYPQKYPLYRNMKILQGPISIFYMTSSKYPHKICLMGENHTLIHKKTSHIQVHEFMNNYINNSSKFIDIFMELKYRKQEYEKFSEIPGVKTGKVWGETYVNKFLQLIPPSCYDLNKDKCYLDTARIHYTDIRFVHTTSLDRDYIKYMNNIIAVKISKKNMDHVKYNSIVKFIKEYFKNNIDVVANKDNIQIFLSNKYNIILKQINNIPNNDIKNYCMYLLSSNPIPIDDVIIKKTYLSSIIKETNDNFIDAMGKIAFSLLNYTSHLTDVYLFARLFRTFTNIKHKYSEPSFNSFIYMGDNHIQNYKYWLLDLGFSLEFEKEDDNGMLDISGLRQPLFMK